MRYNHELQHILVMKKIRTKLRWDGHVIRMDVDGSLLQAGVEEEVDLEPDE